MNEMVIKKNDGIATFMTPQNFTEAMNIAAALSKSELVPKDYKNKQADILVAMAWGAELGLQPLSAIQNIAVINGRPSLWGDAVLALVKSKSDYEYIKETYDEKTEMATCEVKRKNEPAVIAKFSKKDAELAGLWGKFTWKVYPKRMLQLRARGFAIRDAFPHHLKGIGFAEEVQDYKESPSYNTAAIVVESDNIKPPVDNAIECEAFSENTTVNSAEFEQLEAIRLYGIERQLYNSDDDAVDYINKKMGTELQSLYDLEQSAAEEILKKMYPDK